MELHQALGRVLAEDVVADSDLPPFDRSQMDGYAVRAEDAKEAPVRLRIVGESAAGRGWHQQLEEGQAVRIMTGAPVPAGADSVQQVELTTNSKTAPWSNCSKVSKPENRSSNAAQEIKAGETVLTAGTTINAAMMAVLAAFGYAKVEVFRKPRVAYLHRHRARFRRSKTRPGPDSRFQQLLDRRLRRTRRRDCRTPATDRR